MIITQDGNDYNFNCTKNESDLLQALLKYILCEDIDIFYCVDGKKEYLIILERFYLSAEQKDLLIKMCDKVEGFFDFENLIK